MLRKISSETAICHDHKEVAQKQTRDGLVPMASGVFVFEKEKLTQLIDCTESDPHLAARTAKEMNDR